MGNRVGQQLGNYRLLHLLGRGGFAEVYLGEHIYLKRRAALKVLQISLEEEDVEHFLAEAQVLARLDHSNIVRAHEFAVEQGTPFLVMEYASRGTLRQRHPHGSCLSLQTTVAYVKQVAAALQYAHNHQVIHRDVKPENMLLGSQQEVLLSDFGISLLSPSPEQLSTQEMAGTLPYMAPEQIRGKPVFASDQYSLAVIVYEWLCGVRPFEGPSWQIAYQQVSLAPEPLREHDPSLPEAVEEVVLKALAKDPHDRYVSVQLFAQALERACGVSTLDSRSNTEVTVPLGSRSAATPPIPTVVSRRVFLSASSADEAFVARIASDLQKRGISTWHEDPESIQQEGDQQDGVRRAIRAVDIVLLVVSPDTRSSHAVNEHLRIASFYQRQLLFVWVAGEEIAAVLPEEWGQTAQIDLVDARNGRYKQALDEIVACLEEMPVEELALTESAEELREPRNPYKGLRPFTQHDAADFFGRDSLIAELVERLREAGQPGIPQARLLAVIGPSGSGKSSVVMAGLLPRLQGGALVGSERWVYLEPMLPGAHPLEALSLTLASRFPERSLKAIREDLQDESARGLHLLAAQFLQAPGEKVVLIIDQFEELFTQTTAEQERQHFLDLLVNAMTEPQGAVIVILTLRADLYDRPLSYPALGRLIVQRQVLVWPMDVHDLRTVIKRPAALPDVQLSFEGNLVGDLLFEVQGQVGALPLLQFTLEQLFERRNGHMVTVQAYQEIGGVKGALAKHAEATYVSLPSEEHRRLARALFLRLIDSGLTEQDTTRRRAAITELALPDARQSALLKETADAFIKARLLTTNEVAGVTTIEVSHEALIREWARLADWLREGREDIHLQQAVSEDAAEWRRHGKPRDRLYRGSQLKDARAWARRNIPSRNEAAFLQASAVQRVRFAVSLLAIVLLLLSTAGLALRFFLLLSPDPTVVTTLSDSGPGSLREAIATVKPGSTITFDGNVRGIIRLTGDLNLTNNITIRGPGAGTLTISSSNGSAKIHISHGTSASISGLTFKASAGILNEGTLTLIKSTVSDNVNANTLFSGDAGGGITNLKGTLTLINCIISGNKASNWGGGIYNAGMLSLINSTVLGNSSGQDGGGIYNFLSSKLILTNSTVSGNTATDDGGGIENDLGAVMTITNSTVSGNEAGSGGGILNRGQLMLSNSTVSGNTAKVDPRSSYSNDGGGILNDPDGQLTLINSTVSDNTAGGNGGGVAVYSRDPNLPCKELECHGLTNIIFCTIYGNTAASNGGGITIGGGHINGTISHLTQPPRLGMRNSIVAYNHAQTYSNVSGTLTSYGYNLFQDTSGATFDPATRSQHGTDKILSVNDLPRLFTSPVGLRDNGGPTRTYALSPDSPALDQIPLAACHINGITTDQRGVRRPGGNERFCDIGAYESSS